MIDPKTTIYSKLKEIATAHPEVKVFQEDGKAKMDLPCITFRIENDIPVHALDKDELSQNTDVAIDLWGQNSKETSTLLTWVVEKMLEINYICTFSTDLTDPSGISHKPTIFTY